MENKLNNVSISGAGVVGSGEYDNVSGSGSVKINGNIKCKSFSCSGSAKALGNIECAGKLKVSGAFKAEGTIKADELSCAGAAKCEKSLEARILKISGAASVGGDCSAEKASFAGVIKINGLLNAEEIEITLDGRNNDSEISSIGGSVVTVESRSNMRLFKRINSYLNTDTIEADKVELEYTKAKVVRTIDAIIGKGCRIETLEYSGNAEISNKASVKNLVKI